MFTSPNGLCSIQVTDSGIVLGGAGCPLRVSGASVTIQSSSATELRSASGTLIQSGSNTSISSGTNTTVTSGGSSTYSSGTVTNINALQVNLGGPGCGPVARIGDTAAVTGDTATIITGSAVVTAC